MTDDFLNTLGALKILLRDDDGRFNNTEETNAYLVKASPLYMGGYVLFISRLNDNPWAKIKERLASKVGPKWDDFVQPYNDPNFVLNFARNMNEHTKMISVSFPSLDVWKNVRTFIDIGGGNGYIAQKVIQENPHLTGIVSDLESLRVAYDMMVTEDNRERLPFLTLDFFKEDYPKTDAVVYGHILHDWDDQTMKMLINKAFESLNTDRDTYLIVFDYFFDEQKTILAPLQKSLSMRVYHHGRQFSFKEVERWMTQTGFSEFHVSQFAPTHADSSPRMLR